MFALHLQRVKVDLSVSASVKILVYSARRPSVRLSVLLWAHPSTEELNDFHYSQQASFHGGGPVGTSTLPNYIHN